MSSRPFILAVLMLASFTLVAQSCPSSSACGTKPATRSTVAVKKSVPRRAAASSAVPSAPVAKPVPAAPNAIAAPSAGMRVSIDPVDGGLGMPSPDLTTELVRVDEGAPIVVQIRPNGSRRAILDDRFAEFAVATLGPDGKPAWTCVTGVQGAARFLSAPVLPLKPLVPMPATQWVDR